MFRTTPESSSFVLPGDPSILGSLALLLFIACCGCSGKAARVKPPGINPQQAAAAAMEMFDANGDGALAADELDKSPGIRSALETIDANSDGQVSADELATRIRSWIDSKVGVAPAVFTLKKGNTPVGNAEVVLEPEPFLSEFVETATGTTDIFGVVAPLSIPGGMQVGLFRIRVSQKDGGGKEQLPAKYNTETTLGAEVHAQSPALSSERGLVIQLD